MFLFADENPKYFALLQVSCGKIPHHLTLINYLPVWKVDKTAVQHIFVPLEPFFSLLAKSVPGFFVRLCYAIGGDAVSLRRKRLCALMVLTNKTETNDERTERRSGL